MVRSLANKLHQTHRLQNNWRSIKVNPSAKITRQWLLKSENDFSENSDGVGMFLKRHSQCIPPCSPDQTHSADSLHPCIFVFTKTDKSSFLILKEFSSEQQITCCEKQRTHLIRHAFKKALIHKLKDRWTFWWKIDVQKQSPMFYWCEEQVQVHRIFGCHSCDSVDVLLLNTTIYIYIYVDIFEAFSV